MVEILNKSLISDLTTKTNGNKALFVLRNRAHSFVADNWAHERSLHFRYYSGENSELGQCASQRAMRAMTASPASHGCESLRANMASHASQHASHTVIES